MPWEDTFADAIVAACGDNPVLLILGFMFFVVLMVIGPLAVYIGKTFVDSLKRQDKFMAEIFSNQIDSTKSIIEAIVERMDENHDDVIDEFRRQERHLECIKRTAIETKTAVTQNGNHRG
jgi:predicted PurR-regulated permease PerM